MNEMKFVIAIHAPKQKVWQTIWQDKTFRQWASIIDPETYMTGELKEGGQVQFISAASGYGVTSLVEKLVPNEYVLLAHRQDTQKSGSAKRQDQWTGGKESYLLAENDGITTLTISFTVPSELEDEFKVSYPKALEQIKHMAEGANNE